MQISKSRMSTAKSAAIGAIGGAIILAIVGFNWAGWVTAGTAESRAAERADSAVSLALAPICVDNFRRQSGAAAQLSSLQKLAPYDQRGFIEKGGWATPVGSTQPNVRLARDCAEMLSKLTAADLG